MAAAALAIVGVLAAAPSGAARLENPGNGRLYSGSSVISGWKCQADLAEQRHEESMLALH